MSLELMENKTFFPVSLRLICRWGWGKGVDWFGGKVIGPRIRLLKTLLYGMEYRILKTMGVWYVFRLNLRKLQPENFNVNVQCTCAVYSIASVTINTRTCIRSNCVLTRGISMTSMTWRTFIFVCQRNEKTRHKGVQHAQILLHQSVLCKHDLTNAGQISTVRIMTKKSRSVEMKSKNNIGLVQ